MSDEHQESLLKAERELTLAIMEREQAEEALSHAYYLVIGQSPEWSRHWGIREALDEIRDACIIFRITTKKYEDALKTIVAGDYPDEMCADEYADAVLKGKL